MVELNPQLYQAIFNAKYSPQEEVFAKAGYDKSGKTSNNTNEMAVLPVFSEIKSIFIYIFLAPDLSK